MNKEIRTDLILAFIAAIIGILAAIGINRWIEVLAAVGILVPVGL